ncbi:hypothetical protein [Acetobacterium wieringae]|uniref:hypothetical protein n=1 Tax=Acetobacterium wieringae TaxID=52694 RepID=UPI002B208F5D|nr:hypothetical protein [Acetobacterium wieringae]MEA4805129.1 hypothetical protein [Acetobacterium wieringae]
MREKDYLLGVDREVQKKALAEYGIFTDEQRMEALKIELNIAAFVTPYDEVMSQAKEEKSA